MDLSTKKVLRLNAEQSPVDVSVQEKTRKRKRPKAISKIERSLGVIMDKFVLSQHETQGKYMELEEKQIESNAGVGGVYTRSKREKVRG